MNVLVFFATLSLGTSFTAASQESTILGSLSRARAVFDRIDDDGDESLSVDEATLVGIPEEHFHGEDADGDECFSRDEFSVYYYHLLVAAAEDVEADLLDEVALLHALTLSRRPQVSDLEVDPIEPTPDVERAELEATPDPGPRHKTSSLTRARKLLVRLSAEAAFSKPVTHDFRSFFWGRDPRGMGLEQSVPALVRVNAEVDDMLESAFVTEKEAQLLRKALVNRAGPAAARAALDAGQSFADAEEPRPETDGPQMLLSDGDSRGSASVAIPNFDVTRVETSSTDELAGDQVDADLAEPLEVGIEGAGEHQAAMAMALPFFLRLAFPADVEGFSSFLAGPNAGSAPPAATDPVQTEVEASPATDTTDDQDLERGTVGSAPVGLPALQVQVEKQSEGAFSDTTEVPFFIPSTPPVAFPNSDDSVAPGSPTGRPETR
ncbi:MAG: hypothetical protein ACI8QZ_004083 [Chlamydiales bacterium]|jgi:hypothetical protein